MQWGISYKNYKRVKDDFYDDSFIFGSQYGKLHVVLFGLEPQFRARDIAEGLGYDSPDDFGFVDIENKAFMVVPDREPGEFKVELFYTIDGVSQIFERVHNVLATEYLDYINTVVLRVLNLVVNGVDPEDFISSTGGIDA